MTNFLDEIRAAPSIGQAAALLGARLNLGGPAPEKATRRALDDPRYARALDATRKLPDLLARLLAAPEAAPRSSARVTAKAAGSALKWGMEGLEPARPWDISRRLAACRACPHEVPAPDTLVYRGAKVVAGKDARICEICGCLTNTKAAMARERCPEKDPDDPETSRWGEPWTPTDRETRWPWR